MTIDLGKVAHDILGINWRTNAAAIMPIFTAVGIVTHDIAIGQWPSHEEEAAIFFAINVAYGFFVAKDKNVTGGTVSNVDGTVAKPVSLIEEGKVAVVIK